MRAWTTGFSPNASKGSFIADQREVAARLSLAWWVCSSWERSSDRDPPRSGGDSGTVVGSPPGAYRRLSPNELGSHEDLRDGSDPLIGRFVGDSMLPVRP
ncbi:hypothetical protein GCM10009016_17490 [Halomonas beimenensis]